MRTARHAPGAFKADLWRYSVLYAYGGVYLDDDSDIKTPLDEVIGIDDFLIMSEEGSNGFGACYVADFHLSDSSVSKTDKNIMESMDPAYFHGYRENGVPQFFHGHTLVNWGLFVAPRHPLMEKTLNNSVNVILAEYTRKSVLHITRWDSPHKVGLCATMFIMTYTLRDLLLTRYFDGEFNMFSNESRVDRMSGITNAMVSGKRMLPRILVADYRIYGGKCKAIWTGADPNHYTKKMKTNPHLHNSYLPMNVQDAIKSLDGKVVMGEGKSKSIYFVYNSTKREFGSFDNFIDCGFTMDDVRHVKDKVISKLTSGDVMECKRPE